MRRIKKCLALGLASIMILGTTACDLSEWPDRKPGLSEQRSEEPQEASCEELTKSSSAAAPKAGEIAAAFTEAEDFRTGIRKFAAKLLAKSYQGETIMVSPLSLYAALGMLVNGAEGETLSELETMLGCSADTLSKCILYLNTVSEEKDVVRMANSIWINSGVPFTAKQGFLDKCGTYYRSAVMKAPFTDPKTVEAINNWVKEHTKGRIDKIVDALTDLQVMVLINALTFDGTWEDAFEEEATEKDAKFYTAGGTKKVDMMNGFADRYFEDGDMVGFEKDYKQGYLFRAYLPKDGKTVSDIMEKLSEAPAIPYQQATTIRIAMPKFEESSTIGMTEILKELGMKKAFTDAAEFKGISDTEVHVSSVLQKTYIKVHEKGTEAAAVTGILIEANCVREEVFREVRLDHPFVYEIVDITGNIPMFIGVYE